MKRLVFAAALWLGTLACGDNTLEPLPLDVTIQASSLTAAVGQTIDFTVDAQGGSLVSVVVEYGDGTDESFPTFGARTFHTTNLHHAYTVAGTFQVQATVNDATLGSKTATLQIAVN
jgi:hypothetical protein